jgi:hypothetical protein
VHDYRQLEVFELAHKLTLDLYQVTESFPRREAYGLTQ